LKNKTTQAGKSRVIDGTDPSPRCHKRYG